MSGGDMAAATAETRKTQEMAAIAKLEGALDRLLDELQEVRSGAAAVESGDLGDARRLSARVKDLEGENQELRERLTAGLGIAERLAAKIRFLEEKR